MYLNIVGMDEPLNQQNSQSGNIYEVSVYLGNKDMFTLIDHKFYKSPKILNLPEYTCIRYKGYRITRYIELIK